MISATPPTQETNAPAAPVDQFTVNRIADVLGRHHSTIRDALNGREADGCCVISGNAAKTYLVSSLPAALREALHELAAQRGFDSIERLLAREGERWEHPIAIGDLHPPEISRAKKRAAALAAHVGAFSQGTRPAGEITIAAATAHKQCLGYELSESAIGKIIRRAIDRDGGRGEFHRWELYLPENARRARADGKDDAGAAFDHVQEYIDTANAASPTLQDRGFIWTAMCENLQQLAEAGENLKRARCALVQYVFTKAPWMSSSKKSLGWCFAEKWGKFCAGESFISDARLSNRPAANKCPLTHEDAILLKDRGLRGGLSKAWRDAMRLGELSAGVTQFVTTNPKYKSYVPPSARATVGPMINACFDRHRGARQARLNSAHIPRDWSTVMPGDYFQSDDVTAPVYWHEIGPDGPRAIRGQFLPMMDLKSTKILHFVLRSDANYNASTIRGLILRTHDKVGLPRRAFAFEGGIWKRAKLLKGAAEEVDGEDSERGLRDYVEFRHSWLPRGKLIENVIGILQRHMEDQPGYIGRNEMTEKFERVQRKLQLAKAGQIEYSSFLLSRDEWSDRLVAICESYNNEPQGGRLKGLSPNEAWDSEHHKGGPVVKLDGPARRLLANHRRPVTITQKGLRIMEGGETMWFHSEDTGRLRGQKVNVWFNVEDMSSVWVTRFGQDTGAMVVPRTMPVPAMDATREQLDAAKARITAHNRPAINLYREVSPALPKNGPSPFRPTIVSPEFAEESAAISEQQAAIREAQGAAEDKEKQVTRLERKFGRIKGSGNVSIERRLSALKLLEEANQDEHS